MNVTPLICFISKPSSICWVRLSICPVQDLPGRKPVCSFINLSWLALIYSIISIRTVYKYGIGEKLAGSLMIDWGSFQALIELLL